ncbi:hypothetical protein PSX78_23560, partial [Shigella flexneri]|nr:hypothetical protein [Shigella flexneri]
LNKGKVDSASAVIILESYFENNNRRGRVNFASAVIILESYFEQGY